MQVYILNRVLNNSLSTFDKWLWKGFAIHPTPQVIFVTMKLFFCCGFFGGWGWNISLYKWFWHIVFHNLLICTNYWKLFNFQLDWNIQHVAVVVPPLKSLMADQVNTLKEMNIRSISIEPDMSTEAIAGKFIFIMYISQIFN